MAGNENLTGETEYLAGNDGIARAADLLRRGELVAFPTETVYGVGADARNETAVGKIFEAKGRPRFNPLIVHVKSLEAARAFVDFPPWAETLAEAFWPGSLTMVLPGLGRLPGVVSAGRPSLALRVPDHPLAAALLAEVDAPLAAPSANPSGRVSPTTADHVFDGLSGKIAAVLDGGKTDIGVESTIVGGEGPRLLRPGGIAREALEAVLGCVLEDMVGGGAVLAPGQLASHYAPNVAVRLNALSARPGEVFLGFGPRRGDQSLSDTGDLAEAAARLFSALRELEKLGRPIAVAPIPETGLGLAINDRLRRAAVPRG
ncbi:MAG: L-threonylcarbamoyladenylate synthase [Pseudomonadota bacterium]